MHGSAAAVAAPLDVEVPDGSVVDVVEVVVVVDVVPDASCSIL